MLPNINADIKKPKDFQNGSYSLSCSYGQRRNFQKKKRKLSLPVQMKAHKFSMLNDLRLANAQHLPVKSTKKRCAACSTKRKPKRTQWMFQTCKVGLCMYG
ncbi:hypothetical protein TNCV_2216481 [Trichonephila clavipes]|nr:hypothetical protein TNCV_2216481 [Trichonephila clavipes]